MTRHGLWRLHGGGRRGSRLRHANRHDLRGRANWPKRCWRRHARRLLCPGRRRGHAAGGGIRGNHGPPGSTLRAKPLFVTHLPSARDTEHPFLPCPMKIALMLGSALSTAAAASIAKPLIAPLVAA